MKPYSTLNKKILFKVNKKQLIINNKQSKLRPNDSFVLHITTITNSIFKTFNGNLLMVK